MDEKKLNQINTITNEMHDDVASINEEFVDGNDRMVLKYCSKLIEKLKHLMTNIRKDGI